MQCDFQSDRYATDNGPACTYCDAESIWVYERDRRDRSLFVAQCAVCHCVVEVRCDVPDPTIHDIKAAHAARGA